MHSTQLTLIIKVTHRCNLRCSYCGQYKKSSKIIPFEVLSNAISKAFNQVNFNAVNFVWHGGEPLYAGKDFFEKAVFLEKKCNSRGITVCNSLQTNGTMLTDEWAKFLKAEGFNVGLSIDGPKELHDKHRKNAKGTSSFDRVLTGLQLLQAHKIPYGVLTVVNRETLEFGSEKLFKFMLQNGIKTFSFLQERPNYISATKGELYPPITLADFNRFVAEIFDLWYCKDDPDIHVREYLNILQMLFGGQSNICINSGECFGNVLCVDTDGSVYHCDRYLDDSDYKLGNILTDNFSEIIESAKVQKLITDNSLRQAKHKNCKWSTICNGGCPFYALLKDATCTTDEKTCSNAALIEHIYERVKLDLTLPSK
jgi:uncharacterized protein